MTNIRPVAVALGAATDPLPYVNALRMVGLSPELFIPGQRDPVLGDDIKGVVFCGGAAVHPSRFGQELDPNIKKAVDEPRDEMEWDFMDQALARGLPILGICRGFQMINVYFGGSLTQNLSAQNWRDDHRPDIGRQELAHTVVATDGEMATIFGREALEVNSIHRQGIKTLGAGLSASVHTEDGLIEGYESAERNILAVQWHPEELASLPPHRKLLEHYAERISSAAD